MIVRSAVALSLLLSGCYLSHERTRGRDGAVEEEEGCAPAGTYSMRVISSGCANREVTQELTIPPMLDRGCTGEVMPLGECSWQIDEDCSIPDLGIEVHMRVDAQGGQVRATARRSSISGWSGERCDTDETWTEIER